jgi:hypothetical protein
LELEKIDTIRSRIVDAILVDQTEVLFVYKRCALKRVAMTLSAEIRTQTGAAFLPKRSERVCRNRLLLAC